MDLNYLFEKDRLEKQAIQVFKDRIEETEKDNPFFSKLDVGRQKDVVDCLFAIRTSKRPAEIAAARKALRSIYYEYNNRRLREARKWYLKMKEHGNYDDAKNFLEDVQREKSTYNPYS